MSIVKQSCSGYWRDRKGFRKSAITLQGPDDFATSKTFLEAMKTYTNLALMRVTHTTQELEGIAGEVPATGHFDLGAYVARLNFFNYKASADGDSPNVSLTISAPSDSMLEETKEGVWIVTEAAGQAIATLLESALGLSAGDIEFISGQVPEN